jgi:hypothetical protein
MLKPRETWRFKPAFVRPFLRLLLAATCLIGACDDGGSDNGGPGDDAFRAEDLLVDNGAESPDVDTLPDVLPVDSILPPDGPDLVQEETLEPVEEVVEPTPDVQSPPDLKEEPDESVPTSWKFQGYSIDPNPGKPAFVIPADLDKNGTPELVVSVFGNSGPMGNGSLRVYTNSGPLGVWSSTELLTTSDGIKFPNAVTADDVDGDGDLDLIVPYGFLACTPFSCGGILWLEQGYGEWTRHDIVGPGSELFYHRGILVDLNGDGKRDLVTVGEKKGMFDDGAAQPQIFYGTDLTDSGFQKTPENLPAGLGSLPSVFDLDGDGDLDIASAQYFGTNGVSAAWLERTGSGWTKHDITTLAGPSIQLSFIPDLLGDGELTPILANHTNTKDNPSSPESAVFLLTPPANPAATWSADKVSTGIESRKSPMFGPQGAPGVFDWGDMDGDGDIDLLVSGDGDPDIYRIEQTAPGTFTTHTLATDLPQSGVALADIDGDGTPEAIVSSYEANKLVLFRREAE